MWRKKSDEGGGKGSQVIPAEEPVSSVPPGTSLAAADSNLCRRKNNTITLTFARARGGPASTADAQTMTPEVFDPTVPPLYKMFRRKLRD